MPLLVFTQFLVTFLILPGTLFLLFYYYYYFLFLLIYLLCRYKSLPFQMVVTGSVSFFFTYIQLFYIFTSVWGPYQYSFYCALVLSFMLLLITTSCGSICFTYVLISSENHRWWWPSFLNGGYIAFLFLISFLFFFLAFYFLFFFFFFLLLHLLIIFM